MEKRYSFGFKIEDKPETKAGQGLEGGDFAKQSTTRPLTRLYVAYGSNLNVAQMKRRCPDARVVGTAMLDGYELLFKGSKTGSYLTIEKKKGSQVPVAVWKVTEADELALDRYEGYPDFYYKKEIELNITGIVTGKVRKRKAFVYIMHEERELGIPSPYYVHTCLNGYNTFGFDIKYLAKAQKKSYEVTINEKQYDKN